MFSSPVVPHRTPGARTPLLHNRQTFTPLLQTKIRSLSSSSEIEDFEDDFSRPLSTPSSFIRSLCSCSSRESILLLVICLALIVIMTMEVLVRKANTFTYMANYRTLLNQVLVLFCVVAFFGIILYNRVFYSIIVPLNKFLVLNFFLICVFDCIATYMIILSSAYITPPLAALLSQGAIPITMVFSYYYLAKRYKFVHYLGALILILGLGLSIGVIWAHHTESEGQTDASSFGWALVFFLSNIPISIGSIMKEITLSHKDLNKRSEMNTLNGFVALFQFILGMALYPIAYVLQEPGSGLSVHSVPSNVINGIKCSVGVNSVLPSNDINISSNISSLFDSEVLEHYDNCTWWPVLTHILLVIILNILILIVILKGSALLLFIAGGISIPLTSLLAALPFMGDMKVDFEWFDILSVIITLAGLIIYRSKQED